MPKKSSSKSSGEPAAAEMAASSMVVESPDVLEAKIAEHVTYYDKMVNMIPATFYRPPEQDHSAVVNKFLFKKDGGGKLLLPKSKSEAKKQKKEHSDEATSAGGSEHNEHSGDAGKSVEATAKRSVEAYIPMSYSNSISIFKTIDKQTLLEALAEIQKKRGKSKADDLQPASGGKKRKLGELGPNEAVGDNRSRKDKKAKFDKKQKAKHQQPHDRSNSTSKKAERSKADAATSNGAVAPASPPQVQSKVSNGTKKKYTNVAAHQQQPKSTAVVTDFMFGAVDGSANGKPSKKMHDKAQLKKAERFEKKVSELKETDAAKADELLQKKAVSNALLKAQGVKVKDSAAILKKNLKKDEKRKAKSKKMWDEKKKEENMTRKTRLDKRDSNIKGKQKRMIEKKLGLKTNKQLKLEQKAAKEAKKGSGDSGSKK